MTAALRHLRRVDPVMAQLIRRAGPYAVKGVRGEGAYEALVQAVAHQQLTGKAAKPIHEDCGAVGASIAQVQTLERDHAAASASPAMQHLLERIEPAVRRARARMKDEAIIERLVEARGVGRWTVEMFLMFTLGRPDVLPVDDYGVRNGFRIAYGKRQLPKPKALAKFGERWAPYRTTASWYLWRAVDLHRSARPGATAPK